MPPAEQFEILVVGSGKALSEAERCCLTDPTMAEGPVTLCSRAEL